MYIRRAQRVKYSIAEVFMVITNSQLHDHLHTASLTLLMKAYTTHTTSDSCTFC